MSTVDACGLARAWPTIQRYRCSNAAFRRLSCGTSGLPIAGDGKEGSIIVVIATDAPVSSVQLQRIARRAGLGLARTGSTSGNSSGDLFIAFSTANVIPLRGSEKELSIRFLTTEHVEPIFRATVDATEEAILNALTMGTTMEGVSGHVAYQIPYDRLGLIMAKYGRPLAVASH